MFDFPSQYLSPPLSLSITMQENSLRRLRVNVCMMDQVRYHEAVAQPTSASWEEKEKDTSLLNYREFLDVVLRLAVAIRFSRADDESHKQKVLEAITTTLGLCLTRNARTQSP
jgi:hypothetical protein